MYILYGHIELYFPVCSSLKEKRKTLQSIIARTRKRFSISICEAAHQDLWQRSTIGFSAVCSQYSELELMLDAILETVDQHEDSCEITNMNHQVYQYQIDMPFRANENADSFGID